jgi:hypothetical protein
VVEFDRRWREKASPGWNARSSRARLLHVATAPLIYSLLLPLALFDVWVTVYQWIVRVRVRAVPVRRPHA